MLVKVSKPARYINHEWNDKGRTLNSNALKVCLCFPESYELGMSNLGFRIVYGLLQTAEGVFVDRCFLPYQDY